MLKLVKKIIKLIIILLFIVIIIVGGACIFLKVKYDVSVFATISQISQINKEVNAQDSFKKSFTDTDKVSARQTINDQFLPANLITYSETDGYGINATLPTTMIGDILLTEQETAALVAILLANNGIDTFSIAGCDLEFELIEITFTDLQASSVDFGVVIKLDIAPLKSTLNESRFAFLIDKLTDTLYLSSVSTITKGPNAFDYTLTSKSLAINGLDNDGTTNLFKTINTFVDFASISDFVDLISGSVINALIGNETNKNSCFTYALKDMPVLATDYNFIIQDDIIYYVIEKDLLP